MQPNSLLHFISMNRLFFSGMKHASHVMPGNILAMVIIAVCKVNRELLIIARSTSTSHWGDDKLETLPNTAENSKSV